jgi:hypothetical protein
MRFLILIKSDPKVEAGATPSEAYLTKMMEFNEELVKAGIMLSGEGLHPSSRAARVHFSSGKVTVTDGPFTEAKELIAGFWIWKLNSLEEAIEWVKRIPAPESEYATEGDIEIRQIIETEELPEATPELIEREGRLRIESEARQRS